MRRGQRGALIEGIRRHALVRLRPAAWAAELASRPELALIPELAGWAGHDWPLVVRRRCATDRPDRIALGLPLPPSLGKARLSFDVASTAVSTVDPPLPLAAVRGAAPAGWHRTLQALLDLSDHHGVEVRTFGSFAWEILTGLDYLTVGSDLDLLWPLCPATSDFLAALPAIEAEAPGRIDCEVVDAEGAGANWREVAGGARTILLKSLAGVVLVDRAAFLRGEMLPA